MRRKAFTIIEIMIVVVVVGIIATLVMPTYQTIVEKSRQKVCESNLNLLKAAMDVYVMEHDTMPASLSQIPQEYIIRAYNSLKEKDKWGIKFAHFILRYEQAGFAWAEPFVKTIAQGNARLMSCPADSTPPETGGISYGVNSTLANMRYRDYKNLSGDILLIGDCENATFTNIYDLSERHKHVFARTDYAQAVNRSGGVKEESTDTRKPESTTDTKSKKEKEPKPKESDTEPTTGSKLKQEYKTTTPESTHKMEEKKVLQQSDGYTDKIDYKETTKERPDLQKSGIQKLEPESTSSQLKSKGDELKK